MPEEGIGVLSGDAGTEMTVRGALPRKRRVNLAKITRKRIRWEFIVPFLLAVVLGSYFFTEYAVLKRFDALYEARNRLEAVQRRTDDMNEVLDQYYAVRDVYVHLTWSDMTEEENGLVNPLDVAELLERVVLPVQPLEGWSVSGNATSLELQEIDLMDLYSLINALRKEPMVETCTFSSISRTVDPNLVSTTVSIQFKAANNGGR